METRREFFGHLSRGSATVAMLGAVGSVDVLVMYACSQNPTDVWHEIEAWVPTGISAFEMVISLVDPLMSPAITAIAELVKAGFADLAAAIDSYINAPAADKQTWAQKVKLILTALGNNIQSFLSAIQLSGNPIAKVVAVLIQVIVDTISGFVNNIPGLAAQASFKTEFKVGDITVIVHPTVRDRKSFVAAFNEACNSTGHPELRLLAAK